MPVEVYLQPPGFLGTGASLLADLTLMGYILLIVPAMLVGFVFARRAMFRPYHKWTMITITVVNTILIFVLMITAYRFDVAENFPRQPGNSRYLLPTLHAIIGLPAQLLAFYSIYRMVREDWQIDRARKRGEPESTFAEKYFFKRAKLTMRFTLGLWLAAAALGVVSYLIRYDVLTTSAGGSGAPPVATPEVTPAVTPDVTPEIEQPASTAEPELPVSTQEAQPVATEEVEQPASTPES